MSDLPPEFHPREMISAYLDGVLDAGGKTLVERHLRDCAGCRELLEDFRTLSASAAREEPPQLPPDLASRIGRRLEEARIHRERSRLPEWWRPLSLAAAGLAACTMIWLAVRQEGSAPVAPLTVPSGPSRQEAPAAPPAAAKEKSSQAKPPSNPTSQVGAEDRKVRLKSLGYLGPAKASPKEQQDGGKPKAPEAEKETVPTPLAGNRATAMERIPPSAGAGVSLSDSASRPEPSVRKDRDASLSRTGTAGIMGESLESSRESQKLAPGSAARASRKQELSAGIGSPRSLLYETPDVSITLTEEGMVTLVQRGYACSVSVASPAPEGGAPSLPPELASLFKRAGSREMLSSVPEGAPPGATSPEAESLRPKSLTLRNSEGDALYTIPYGDAPGTSPPGPVLALEEEIRRAIATSFRKALEERCGPIPAASSAPP
jgi:putative zinc finger protein